MPEGVVILCRNYLGERIAVAVRVVHCIWRLQLVIDIMLQEFMEILSGDVLYYLCREHKSQAGVFHLVWLCKRQIPNLSIYKIVNAVRCPKVGIYHNRKLCRLLVGEQTGLFCIFIEGIRGLKTSNMRQQSSWGNIPLVGVFKIQPRQIVVERFIQLQKPLII